MQITGGPNSRSSSGLIQLDSSQNITFDGTLNFVSYKYYVGTSVYFDHIGAYYSIFSIFTTVRLTSTTLHTPLWTSIIYVGTNYLVLYGYLYGATAFNGYYIITSITLTGWQYVGCYLENTIVGGSVVNKFYYSKLLFTFNILLN